MNRKLDGISRLNAESPDWALPVMNLWGALVDAQVVNPWVVDWEAFLEELWSELVDEQAPRADGDERAWLLEEMWAKLVDSQAKPTVGVDWAPLMEKIWSKLAQSQAANPGGMDWAPLMERMWARLADAHVSSRGTADWARLMENLWDAGDAVALEYSNPHMVPRVQLDFVSVGSSSDTVVACSPVEAQSFMETMLPKFEDADYVLAICDPSDEGVSEPSDLSELDAAVLVG